jgi:hypothetical protein
VQQFIQGDYSAVQYEGKYSPLYTFEFIPFSNSVVVKSKLQELVSDLKIVILVLNQSFVIERYQYCFIAITT